jgi:hypothetical protein
MIDKYFKFQLVVNKTVATCFSKGVHPGRGDFGFSCSFFTNGGAISPSDNALGRGLKYAGE